MRMKRWLRMSLCTVVVALSLGGCHILDATVTFINELACGFVTCSRVRLTLTSQDVPLHMVQLDLVIGASQTMVMDAGNYVWNLPGEASICTPRTSGTVVIAKGASTRRITCASGLVQPTALEASQ